MSLLKKLLKSLSPWENGTYSHPGDRFSYLLARRNKITGAVKIQLFGMWRPLGYNLPKSNFKSTPII